ncbi:Clavaminate synthase-like protein [Stipitochalara longipes BDJ]|nr:Clavaminate synthase-like protein [Stipitochalara longipes BDJ]
MNPTRPEPPDPIIELLTTYNELNSSQVDELSEVPSALEFMRCVRANRPFVVRGAAEDWSATRTWNVETLKELLEGQSVQVAVTPEGNADSPTRNKEGELVFVKPWEEQQRFSEFIDFISSQEKSGHNAVSEVRYAQTQNDNLRNEYATLFSHVEKDIPWARIALQEEPEAINLWIGNSRSVTALHKDNYENIYVQIRGEKHFTLLPPLAYACVAERELTPASYVQKEDGSLEIQEEEGDKVPFPTWDPDGSGHETRYSKYAQPMKVTLRKGDLLYLPALWYHKVSQSTNEEGICCAVNYWYNMEWSGSFYPLCNFARSAGIAVLNS